MPRDDGTGLSQPACGHPCSSDGPNGSSSCNLGHPQHPLRLVTDSTGVTQGAEGDSTIVSRRSRSRSRSRTGSRRRDFSKQCNARNNILRDWLASLDNGHGSMLQYQKKLEEEFDGSFFQIAAAAHNGAAVASVDPVFFAALGVNKLGHRLILAKGVLALAASGFGGA